MTYCSIEGCLCTTKAGKWAKFLGTSYRIFGICPCCGKELFPKGIKFEGKFYLFNAYSQRCYNQHKKEQAKILIENRDPKTKEKLTIEVKSKLGGYKKW